MAKILGLMSWLSRLCCLDCCGWNFSLFLLALADLVSLTCPLTILDGLSMLFFLLCFDIVVLRPDYSAGRQMVVLIFPLLHYNFCAQSSYIPVYPILSFQFSLSITQCSFCSSQVPSPTSLARLSFLSSSPQFPISFCCCKTLSLRLRTLPSCIGSTLGYNPW